MLQNQLDMLSFNNSNYFLNECSNPVSWYRRHAVQDDLTSRTGLYCVLDMKHTVLTEQYADNKPEYVWSLFLYNTYISFNYIMQDNMDKALEIINETEKILSKLTKHSTDFLDSIKEALCHITLTTKGYILTKCNLSTECLGSFVALCDMDKTNKAALYAVQSCFSARYINKWCILSKICLLRAISLNPTEPEWHYMLSYCLTNYRKRLFMTKVLPQELEEAEIAVSLSNSPQHKCHLAKLLHCVNSTGSYTQDTLKAIQLIKDIVNDSDDIFTLRRSLKIITKMLTTHNVDSEIISLAKIIISKIINSNNSFVQDSVGHYYLHYEKDFEKAKTYLKMASDGGCFGASIDYMHLLFTLDPNNTNVVEILNGYLDEYPFLSSQQTILCLIISYQLIYKKDIIGALKYIDKLLDIKALTLVRRMQTYRTKFSNPSLKLNLLNVIHDELEKNLNNETLSAENISSVKRLYNKIGDFNSYIDTTSINTEKKVYHDLDSKISFLTQNEIVEEDKCCSVTNSSNNQQSKASAPVKMENWRTLKPNDGPNVFTLNKHRYFDRQHRPTRQNDE